MIVVVVCGSGCNGDCCCDGGCSSGCCCDGGWWRLPLGSVIVYYWVLSKYIILIYKIEE